MQRSKTLSRRQFLKATAIVAGAAVATPLLQACSSAPAAAPTATTAAAAAPTPTTAAASGEAITIRLQDWRWAEDVSRKIFTPWVDAFHKSNASIKIEPDPVPWDQKLDKLTTQVVGGDPPDVVALDGQEVAQLVKAGHLTVVDSLWEKEGAAFKDAFFEGALLGSSFQGKQYGLPKELGTMGCYFYHLGLFKDAGLDVDNPPKTWDEFLDAAKKLTKPDKNQYGTLIMAAQPADAAVLCWYWTRLNGAEVISEDATKSLVDAPEAIEGFTWFVELYTKHKVVANPIDIDYPTSTKMWTQEQIGMYHGGPWNVALTHDKNPNMKGQFRIVPLPAPAGKPVQTWGFTGVFALPKGAKHPEQSWEVMKWMGANPDNQLDYATNAGFLGSLKATAENPKVRDDEFLKAYASLLPVAKPFVQNTHWTELQQAQWTELQAALLGQKTPDQASKDAALAMNAILAKG